MDSPKRKSSLEERQKQKSTLVERQKQVAAEPELLLKKVEWSPRVGAMVTNLNEPKLLLKKVERSPELSK